MSVPLGTVGDADGPGASQPPAPAARGAAAGGTAGAAAALVATADVLAGEELAVVPEDEALDTTLVATHSYLGGRCCCC